MLHIAVKRIISGPQYQPHIPFPRILHQHRQVYLGHHLKQISLLVHRPPFVQYDVLYAILRSKVYIVLIGVVVYSGFEIHTPNVPVVPPVPRHLAGLYPAEVGHLAGLSQQIAHIVHGQLRTVLGHHCYAPRQHRQFVHFGNVFLTLFHQHLQVVVPALLQCLGIGGVLSLQPSGISHPFQVEAGIVGKGGLGEAHLHPVGRMHQQREETKAALVKFGQLCGGVQILERRHILSLVPLVGIETGHIRHCRPIVAGKVILHLLEPHIARPQHLIAVRDAFVIRPEHHTEVLAHLQRQFVVAIPHGRLSGKRRGHRLVHSTCGRLADGHTSVHTLVIHAVHPQMRGQHNGHSIIHYVVCYFVLGCGHNMAHQLIVWRLQGILLLLGGGLHAKPQRQHSHQKATQKTLHIHIVLSGLLCLF